AAAEPVAFDTSEAAPVEYAADGQAVVAGALRRGERYTAWSDLPNPDPAALARSPARYPASILTYLAFQDGRRFPSFGTSRRVAVGFTPGRLDRGVWTVTERDAHAWVEAWFAGYGWLPFDPTPGRAKLDAPYSASSAAFDPGALLRALRGAGSRQTAFERKLDRQFSGAAVIR